MNRYVSLLVILAALVAVGGCRKGPAGEALTQEVQTKLNRDFQAGLFEVDHLARRGSYPYQEEGDERERLLIYYDARLRFLKDYKLSDWDQLNVGSLVSVLGATPLGVQGVNPEGNMQGDYLEVYGTSAYLKDEGEWVASTLTPATKQKKKVAKEPPPEGLPYQEKLALLDETARKLNKAGGSFELKELDRKLDEALASARRGLAKRNEWMSLATGMPTGEYAALGSALVASLEKAGYRAAAFESRGSIENVRLLERKEVLFAFIQNDIAHMALTGSGLFRDRLPAGNLRALCSLYPEAVQIVTLADSSVKSLADLAGKRVDVGLAGSGVRVNAMQVIRAAGLGRNELKEVKGSGIEEALTALAAGEVDAVFVTAAWPAEAISTLASQRTIRLVSIGKPVVERLKSEHPFFIPVRIPGNSYEGIEGEVQTVGVTAMLVAHADAPDGQVKAFMQHLFDNIPALSKKSLQAYYVSRENGRLGVSLPLHPAAEAVLGTR